MQLTAAQTIILNYFGPNPGPAQDYKAPHALRGTPARPHHPRNPDIVFSKSHDAMVHVCRPFKGHRP